MEVNYIVVNGCIVAKDSDEGKEYMRWEKPYRFEPFPKMLYMARKRPDGVVSVSESNDRLFSVPGQMERAGAAEAFNASCQKTVKSEDELRVALEQGWRPTPQEALERFDAKERAIGDAAANRAWSERNMSEAAKAEAAAVDASTEDHVPTIPETPIRRSPGRPRKTVAAA